MVRGFGTYARPWNATSLTSTIAHPREESVQHRRISTEYRTTAKLEFIAIILIASMVGFAAYAQDDGGYVAPELSQPAPGHLLNQDYLTSTGETVPRPGVPQSSGETPLDRYIQQQDDRIDNSICRGC